MLREFLNREDDALGVADRRVKPALLTLMADQAELIDSAWQGDREPTADIRVGFPDRRALLEWYQKAAVRTLGHIADDWDPVSCVVDKTLLESVLRNPPSKMEKANPETAYKHRAMIESGIVIPACNKAYRALRPHANEYIKTPDQQSELTETESNLDPLSQKNLAMRPGFQTIDAQQAIALNNLWGGFESYEELMNWIHALNSPTNGEIRNDISQLIVLDDDAMQHFVYNRHTPIARVYRELFAAVEILPAFVHGVRTTETAELARTVSEGATTLRMKSTATS